MRLPALFLALSLGRLAAAQAPGAIVSGVVYDSLARGPLAGAMVQLVAADAPGRFNQNANADDLGRFRFDSVPNGRYMLGFFHPMLDSLVVEAPLREISVIGGRAMKADLAIPSPARLRAAICADTAGAVVMGIVRNARDGAAIAGASVSGEWAEYTLSTKGMSGSRATRSATTRENGWFALCNVPRGGTMALSAVRGADSTDVIEFPVPAEGFARRELFLGPMRIVASADSATRVARHLRLGDGRLTGTVIASEGGRPVGGAQVGIVGGPLARTNERGEWTLVNVPEGTRVLEVRGVSYYPTRRIVDVVPEAPPVHVQLATLRAVLDTVRVTAGRLRGKDIAGFMERQRSGSGTYLDDKAVAKRAPTVLSDVFRSIAGVRLESPRGAVMGMVTMRGAFEATCSPAFFLDGHYMGGYVTPGFAGPPLTTDEIDGWARPDQIAGIEVYTDGAPPQFQQGLTACGSIVIWTK
ncbi:MAG: carboxypeptidase regulatory-like domain-containing protein [Gemmatimonadaceae bacterium]